MALEILGLLAASAGASYGWWWLQRRRERQYLLERPRFSAEFEIALSVAQHEAQSRQHTYISTLHLLYGLLQVEDFTAAIARLGGDATAMETHIQARLDQRVDPEAEHASSVEASELVGYAYAIARSHDRPASCTDLWAGLVHTKAAQAMCGGRVDPTALLFLLAHGMPEPTTELADRVDVHIVLRNDDYTTRDLVVEILRDIFKLSDADATTRMEEAHHGGRTVIARAKLTIAREQIAAAREHARKQYAPLWLGVEDC